MSLPALRLGRRYAVRVVTASPTTGDEARDLVGTLVAADAATWTLLPEDRGPEVVSVRAVRAAREVPPRRVRPTSSVDDLERLAARGWPGLAQHRLGGWLLREGAGWTGRANSALVVGDPGLPIPDAVTAVEKHYRDRGLRPRFQVPFPLTGHAAQAQEVDAHLASHGYEPADPTLVQVADLRQTPDEPLGDLAASWFDDPTGAWLTAAGAETPREPHEIAVTTATPARYLVLQQDSRPVARARLALTDDWAGLTGLLVKEDLRGRGIGRRAMGEVVREARRQDARFAYLQVLEDNAVARGVYDTLGWRTHHRYHYRVAPRD